jgi:hypothetical protein
MRSIHWSTLCMTVATTFVASAAMAQDCASAPNAAEGPNPFTTTAGTGNLAMPAGGGCGFTHTIFNVTYFTFTATVSGVHTFALCGGSTWDTRIAVLNTCDPAAGVLGCNDDGCGLQSQTTATLVAGTTYKVAIGGFGATGAGAGSLIVTLPSGGGGGGGGGGGASCADAPVAVNGPNPFTTVVGSGNLSMPAGGGCAGAHTINNVTYFSYTAAAAGVHTFSLCGGSTWDTRIAVLNTCDPAAGVLGCNDDFCSLQSQTTATLVPGTTYKIAIGGYGSGGAGPGTLTVTAPGGGGGGGGACSSEAPVFLVGDNAFTNTSTGSVLDLAGVCDPGTFGDDSIYNTNYYRFTPKQSGSYQISTCGLATWDTRLAVLNTCDIADGVLACNDDGAGCPNFSSLITAVELVGGEEYFIAVGGYGATTPVLGGTVRIGLNGGGGGGCEKAPALVVGLNEFSTIGQTATVDLTGICDPGAFGDDLIYNAAFYKFTPAKSGLYTLSTCNLADFDTRLAVMEGCTPADGVLACNDDGPASCALFTSVIPAVELAGGVEYVVVIGGFSAAESGAGQIEISPFVPCDLGQTSGQEAEACGDDLNGGCNDTVGGLPSEPISIGDVVAGTFWADGGTRDTDWYLLTLTESTDFTITLRSSLDSFAAVTDVDCSLNILAATEGTCPGTASVCLPEGQYYIVVLPGTFEGFPCGGAAGNDYSIGVSLTGAKCTVERPANDLCADAQVAVEGANPFDNTFASTDVTDPSCGTGGAPFLKDIWFSFTATQTGGYRFETCTGPAPFDTGIEIWDNCPDLGGSVIACNDDGADCTAFASQLDTKLVKGTTYLVRVAGWDGAVGATDLVIGFVGDIPGCGDPGTGDCCAADTTPFCEDAECCSTVCAVDSFCCEVEWDQICADQAAQLCASCFVEPPANDECAGAVTVTAGETAFSTAGATGATLACTKFEQPNVNNDIWFKYVADGDGELVISLCGSSFDTKMAVFEGSCTGALVACDDDADAPATCADTLQSEVRFTPVCGTEYYISVGAFSAVQTGAGVMNITPSGKCGSACPADFNNDGVVDSADLGTLLAAWGTAGGDTNSDGTTDSADLGDLLAAWGNCQ